MKKRMRVLMAGICLLASFGISTEYVGAERKSAPSISAEAGCVIDVQSGAVLYDKNMNKREYPASITKIMTTLVALENCSLSEEVEYGKSAFANWEPGASNASIEVGEKMNMKESLYAVMLASANEACNGVADHIAGSIDAFVGKMNEKAQSLGCKNTHFANTNGLWKKDHYTTAYDMALIGRAAIQNKDFKEITGSRSFIMSKTNKRKAGYPLANHHKMINPGDYPQYGYEYCEGGKTGYTSKCRNTLVTFAKKGNMELVCVILKCDNSVWLEPNAYTDTTKLFNYCFANYEKTSIQQDMASDINEQYLFTKFSPFYSKSTSSLHIEEEAGIILPKGVSADKAEKKVEYFDQPQEMNGKKVIGRLSYIYKGQEVGGSNIYFEDNDSLTLKDSIDMSKWFDEAIEVAKKEPFPWKKCILIIILATCVLGLSIICFFKVRAYQVKTESRRRFKKDRHKLKQRERDFYTRRLK
ncbi:MAG: D-alanyl-D-alanine carboxypeptidase [Eubacterium sp.]|nr:D-alanyl-D-alanine carboxypeptidase [Eubacterium sp.]MCI9410575.1 D-alanyl-D-alanine carboxypeptidase [Eubacterium sp.]